MTNKKRIIVISVFITIIAITVIIFATKGINTNTHLTSNAKVKLCDYSNIDLKNNVDENKSDEQYVLEYLLTNSEVNNISQEEVNQYIEDSENYYKEYAALAGMTYEDYITDVLNTDLEIYKNDLKTAAENYVKTKAILETVADKEKIDFSNDDYEKYLEILCKETNYENVDALKQEIMIRQEEDEAKESAFSYKVTQHIIDMLE